MALVSITEAAKLVRRNRSTLYRDIERGRLSKTVTPEGETQIETSELLRTYGRIHANDAEHGDSVDHDKVRIAILEERNRSLERALTLEAELRKVKDQVTTELRARLADKDSVIKVLESKVLFLEYDRQVESLKPEPVPEPVSSPASSSVSQAVSEPAAQPAPQPASQTASTPDPEPAAMAATTVPVSASVSPEAAKPPAAPEQSAEPVRRGEEHATVMPASEMGPQQTSDAGEPTRSDPPISDLGRDAAVPMRETEASLESFMQPSAQPKQAETPIISSHVMPRKSWWARLLHRR